ncbi:MAG: hypothetical protein ACFB15_30645 [Cyclobacteriaceae bacterium]
MITPVFVFRTSVTHQKEVNYLRPLLNALVDCKGRWNFDLDDCDNTLRVEAKEPHPEIISSALQAQGFLCEEL